jgi:hypothetical protein
MVPDEQQVISRAHEYYAACEITDYENVWNYYGPAMRDKHEPRNKYIRDVKKATAKSYFRRIGESKVSFSSNPKGERIAIVETPIRAGIKGRQMAELPWLTFWIWTEVEGKTTWYLDKGQPKSLSQSSL